MPAPEISSQPVCLQIRQPLPPHATQEKSYCTLGSVKGKKSGRKRTLTFPPKSRGEVGHIALQLGHRDPFVHVQALALMEGEGVGGVGVLVAVGAPRHDHPHRGFLLFHDPDLHRRGMGPEHDIAAEIEGVLGIPAGWSRGMFSASKL